MEISVEPERVLVELLCSSYSEDSQQAGKSSSSQNLTSLPSLQEWTWEHYRGLNLTLFTLSAVRSTMVFIGVKRYYGRILGAWGPLVRLGSKVFSLDHLWALDTLSTASAGHVDKIVFGNVPTHGRPAKVMWPVSHTLGWLNPCFVPCHSLVSYCLWLCLILDIMKICMDFDPYGAFSSFDVPQMVDQQNSWNSLVIDTYLLYLEWNVGMLTVNICILWPPPPPPTHT
jgi:hypothetical protein